MREITFENGEELTEEGLPFLLLFHKPDDVTSIQRFKNAVMRELMHERGLTLIVYMKSLHLLLNMRSLSITYYNKLNSRKKKINKFPCQFMFSFVFDTSYIQSYD